MSTDTRRVTVMHQGEFYTVVGEWDPGAVSMSRECPDEPAGFEDPRIFDMNGRNVTNELGSFDFERIVSKAEAEETEPWTKSFLPFRRHALT